MKKRCIMLVLVMVLVMIFIYALVIHPLIVCWIPPKVYKGVEYYEDGSYQNFEKGELFFESFYSYEFADKCEIKDFYYADNKAQDSAIYGKMYDFYIMELDVGQYYEEIRQYIVENGTECIPSDYYELYVMPEESGKKRDYFYYAFNDDEQKIRYLLVTEIKVWSEDFDVDNVERIIYLYSGYQW